jgi:hypothetical protein
LRNLNTHTSQAKPSQKKKKKKKAGRQQPKAIAGQKEIRVKGLLLL